MKIFDQLKKIFFPKKVKEPKIKEEKKEIKRPLKAGKSKYTEAYRILVKPMVGEKVTDLEMRNQYVFEVAKKANKIEVKKAVEAIYGKSPIGINIINIRGKKKRFGRVEGRTKERKKAIVTLREGERIEAFEKG